MYFNEKKTKKQKQNQTEKNTVVSEKETNYTERSDVHLRCISKPQRIEDQPRITLHVLQREIIDRKNRNEE